MTDQHADATEEDTSEPGATPPNETRQDDESTETGADPTLTSRDSDQSGDPSDTDSTGASSTTASVISTGSDSSGPPKTNADDQSSSGATTTEVEQSSAASSSATGEVSSSEPEPAGSGETDPGATGSAPSTMSNSGADSSSSTPPTSEPGGPDPADECPDHDQRVAGPCGCGHEPDPKCKALSDALIHRYAIVSHAEEGEYPASIPDSVGSANASVHDSRFDWDGSLLLDGSDSYLQFPSGLLSSRDEITLDLWVKWWGGGDNQRLLNFGLAPNSDDAPDNFLSISPSGGNGVLTVQYRTNPDERGDKLEAEYSLPTTDLHHLTLVIRAESFELYVNGESVGSVETLHHLHDLDDTDNWLGRALYSEYPLYNGALYEFRVFERALKHDEVAKMDEVGLDLP